MINFNTNNSPFLVLWYMYLAFLGAVILINVIAFLTSKIVLWRTRRLERKYAPPGSKS